MRHKTDQRLESVCFQRGGQALMMLMRHRMDHQLEFFFEPGIIHVDWV